VPQTAIRLKGGGQRLVLSQIHFRLRALRAQFCPRSNLDSLAPFASRAANGSGPSFGPPKCRLLQRRRHQLPTLRAWLCAPPPLEPTTPMTTG